MYKHDMKEERKARSNVRQVLRMRRHNLKTLQAILHATEMESEAFAASAVEAVGQTTKPVFNSLRKNTIHCEKEEKKK